MDYLATRARVEDYFDRSATQVWERLTSDAPVSGVRATVRQGREEMLNLFLGALPEDLSGRHVLDAGCGTGMLATALASRGAKVTAIDIAPQILEIAQKRLEPSLGHLVDFTCGDMAEQDLGQYDHVVAMDSLIYYRAPDIAQMLQQFSGKDEGQFLFSLPPRTSLLMAMYYVGKLFPNGDRSPLMVPQNYKSLVKNLTGHASQLHELGRVHRGFYHAQLFAFKGGVA